MAARKNIIIEFPANMDGALTHQVRNLGEDLWRSVEREKLGDVGGLETVDRATSKLEVRVFHARKVGTVKKLVELLLEQHLLTDRSRVSQS